MNIGWLLYKEEDVEKNKHYIDLFIEKFSIYNVKILPIVLEKTDIGSLVRNQPPAFAVNRSRDWKVAEKLENLDIKVFNSSKVTRIANDKTETYKFLEGIVPFMEVESKEEKIEGLKVNKQLNYPYVIKSNSGHGGSEIFLVNNFEEEKRAISLLRDNSYLRQHCCSDVGRDIRVYILGNNIVKTMLRTSEESFKSNYSLGGAAEEYKLNSKEKEMVGKILEKIPMDYGGIDFIFHRGRAVFNEIEDAVGARMLYQIAKIDIVKLYVEYIAELLHL